MSKKEIQKRRTINTKVDNISSSVMRWMTGGTKISVSFLSGSIFLLLTVINFWLIHVESNYNAYLYNAVDNHYIRVLLVSAFGCILGMAGFINLFNWVAMRRIENDKDKLYKQVLEGIDEKFLIILNDTIADKKKRYFIIALICIPLSLVVSFMIMMSSVNAIPYAIDVLGLQYYLDPLTREWVKSDVSPESSLKMWSYAYSTIGFVVGVVQGLLAPPMNTEQDIIEEAANRMSYVMTLEGEDDWDITSKAKDSKKDDTPKKEDEKKEKEDEKRPGKKDTNNKLLSLGSLGKILNTYLGIDKDEYKDWCKEYIGINPKTGMVEAGEHTSDSVKKWIDSRNNDNPEGQHPDEAIQELQNAIGGSAKRGSGNDRGFVLVKLDRDLKKIEDELKEQTTRQDELTEKIDDLNTDLITADTAKKAALTAKIEQSTKALEMVEKEIENLETQKSELESEISVIVSSLKDWFQSENYPGKMND